MNRNKDTDSQREQIIELSPLKPLVRDANPSGQANRHEVVELPPMDINVESADSNDGVVL